MMYQTFAHKINRAKTLLDGLNSYGESVSQLGITKELVAKITDLYNQAGLIEQKKNDLMASSREATTTQQEIMKELNHQSSLARKSIRVNLPEEKWLAFGFRAGESGETESSNQATTN